MHTILDSLEERKYKKVQNKETNILLPQGHTCNCNSTGVISTLVTGETGWMFASACS